MGGICCGIIQPGLMMAKPKREAALRAGRKYESKNRDERRERNRKWALANPDKVYTEKRKQQVRDWKLAHPGYQRDRHREKKYGLSKEAFDAILETQNFRCAACTCDLRELTSKNVHVDHCHLTQRIRGILCNGCNASLGFMKEDVEKLKGLISYIGRFK